MLLVAKTIDPATQCWLEKQQIRLENIAELIELLDLEDFEFNAVYDLEPFDLRLLEDKYGFSFDHRDLDGK